MPQKPSNDDVLTGALAIAADKDAQVRFAGGVQPDRRSIWSKMNLKVKILVLGIPAAAIFAMHPFSSPVHAVGAGQPASHGPVGSAASPKHGAASAAVAAAPAAASAPSSARPAATTTPLDPLAAALGDDKDLTSYQISQRLYAIDPFASLATAVEDFKRKPYYDPGGLNVGMGYCVTKRISEYGSERVADDLSKAGFEAAQVQALLKNKRSAVAKIDVTPLMAVRLMDETRLDYQTLARDAIGPDVFDKMPAHRQAAMSYMAYNTGDVGKFKQLVAGLRSGSDLKAMSNMAVIWHESDASGNVTEHVNHRLRSYVQAMFLGAEHFKRAIDDPKAFEDSIASPSAESALADLAAAEQKPNGLQSKILERRLKSNPWAFKAFKEDKQKLPGASGS